jgi:hypothetical protein
MFAHPLRMLGVVQKLAGRNTRVCARDMGRGVRTRHTGPPDLDRREYSPLGDPPRGSLTESRGENRGRAPPRGDRISVLCGATRPLDWASIAPQATTVVGCYLCVVRWAMINHDISLWQSWLDVYRALEALESRPVSIGSFRTVQAEAAWRFAVDARGPDAERRPHRGPSPWLAFTRDQPANRIRELLPLWLSERRLRAIPLEEFDREVARDPMLQRRTRIGVTLMAHLVAHPVDWQWLQDIFEELHPRPLIRRDDDEEDDEEVDVLFSKRRPRHSSDSNVREHLAVPPPPSVHPSRTSSRPVPGWRRLLP